jgi:hypothetical protein
MQFLTTGCAFRRCGVFCVLDMQLMTRRLGRCGFVMFCRSKKQEIEARAGGRHPREGVVPNLARKGLRRLP